MNPFRMGPVSISLLAVLTAASMEVHAQEQTDPTPPSSADAPATPEVPAPPAPPATPAVVAPSAAAKPEAGAKAERITVTGSRIREIEMQGPKPVVTVDAKEIEKSGASNVNEYLEKLTLASFGSTSYGSSYGAAAGTQGFDLRGLGSGNTLVLLNGRRLVRDPSLEFIDLSIIPTAAVERIDILKGTASAIYGTDAAAGVVNIITRKEFDGMAFGYSKFKSRYSESGDTDQAYAIAGTSSDKSTNIITFQWDQSESSKIGNRPWVDKNFRSIYGSPMSYLNADGDFQPAGNCDFPKANGTFCGYNYMDEYEWSPAVQKISVLDDYSYNLSKNTKLGVRLFATKKTAVSKSLKGIIDESSDAYLVSEAALATLHPEITNAGIETLGDQTGVRVHGRIAGANPTMTKTDQLTYSGSTSVTHEFDNGDSLDVSFSESRIERTHHWLNFWDGPRLKDAVYTGAFDVFAATPQTNLDEYRLDVADRDMSIARSIEATYTGNFNVWNRDFGYAAGISQIRESYNNKAAPNKLAGFVKDLGGGGGTGERKANAAFAEIKVPIVDTLEASVAARYDDYTDFGDTFNPALGLQYRIGKEWFFRANYGTGFKAPTLREVHDGPATYYDSAIDYTKCNIATQANDAVGITQYCDNAASGTTTAGGNSDLKPEESSTYSLFIGFEPVQGYGVNVEYFNSKIDDRIGAVSADQLTQLESEGRALPPGTAVIRDPVTGDITSFLSPTANLSSLKTSGLDTSAYASQQFGFGTLSYKTNYSYLLSYESQDLPGGPFVQQLETGGAPRWRWNNTFGYALGINDVSLTSRTNGRYQKANKVRGYVGSFTSWDLNYGVEVSQAATVNVGAENVFNQQYPQDDSDATFRGVGGSFFQEPTYYARFDFRI
jgi:iron complex outermembrane receptor protein